MAAEGSGTAGSQALMRGLDVIEAVASGATTLNLLSAELGLTRSTAHRLATSLVKRGYLAFAPRAGYRLGAKLLQLGYLAQSQTDMLQAARPHLEALSLLTGDAVHFGIRDGDRALYLDKMAGQRRITISSRIGERQPLSSTGLGKALMLDHDEAYWRERLAEETNQGSATTDPDAWVERMHGYVRAGYAFDLEENEDQIRCVAAPVRDVSGRIVGAISVSSAAQYMNDERMQSLGREVTQAARAISADLGWSSPAVECEDAA